MKRLLAYAALFLLVVGLGILMPETEMTLDTPHAPILARAENAVQVRYTPVPTPSPTPSPTPVPTPSPSPSPAPLVAGDSGPDVQALQQQLVLKGFLVGEADGHFGPATEAAVSYAKQALGQTGDGRADWQTLQALASGEPLSSRPLALGDTGDDVMRVQRRLGALGYIYNGVDGNYGDGTQQAVAYFQGLAKLPQTGIADAATQELLFSSVAPESDKPTHEYKVVVDISDQRVYVYAWSDGEYGHKVRTMRCSTGTGNTPTPTGTFQETVRRGERWHHFSTYGGWAQYAIHIDPTGNIMFHSVLYNSKGGSPTSASVNNLGTRASHGCIRLAVKDAKWLYEHCVDGTTVVIKK